MAPDNLGECKQSNVFHCNPDKEYNVRIEQEDNRSNRMGKMKNLQFESPSTRKPLSFVTHTLASSSPSSVLPIDSRSPPDIKPLIHSYSNDMAGVVRIRFVIGGTSFFVRRGSSGVSVANCSVLYMSACFPLGNISPWEKLTSLMILIVIQLLLLVVRS